MYPIVRLGGRYQATELAEKARLLGLDEPILVDDDGRLQKALGAAVVPSLSLVDSKGTLCFTQASSLKQPVLNKVDVREAVRMAARGEEPPLVYGLVRYYPANDLVGETFRDLTLPSYLTGDSIRLADHVKPGRLTVIFYWGARCPHSRRAMPTVVSAVQGYGGKYLDLISVVRLKDGETKADIQKYVTDNRINFPVLEDRGRRFTTLYRVVTTPTFIVIRPDGVVDSVYTSGGTNYNAVVGAKVANLLLKGQPKPAGL